MNNESPGRSLFLAEEAASYAGCMKSIRNSPQMFQGLSQQNKHSIFEGMSFGEH